MLHNSSSAHNNSRVGLTFCVLKINNKLVVALIDTGASCSLIKKGLGLEFITLLGKSVIKGISDKSLVIKEKCLAIVNIPNTDIEYKINPYVVDNNYSYDIILGSDFLNKSKAIIAYGENQIIIENNSMPFFLKINEANLYKEKLEIQGTLIVYKNRALMDNIKIAEDYIIMPYSILDIKTNLKKEYVYSFEPNPVFKAKKKTHIIPFINQDQDSNCFVRFINLDNEPKLLKKEAIIG
jgi:Retroviral aspartyl protease